MRTSFAMCIAVATLACTAQSRNDNWFAYRDVWFSFTNGAPQNLLGHPWCISNAALSAPAGDLLLFSKGDTLYNSTFLPVMGSNGLVTHSGKPQDNIILPLPNDPGKLVVVSRRYFPNIGFCGYITVDMSMDNGLGGTTDTAIHRFMELPVRAAFPLTAVPHANGTDYWILLHEEGTDAFFAHLLTDQGVDGTPVISHTGAVYPVGHTAGIMAASYQGDLVAITAHSESPPIPGDSSEVELFHFDAATGEFDHICSFPGYYRPKSVEFSPLGTKLYVAEEIMAPVPFRHELWQYDLSDMNCSAIQASATVVYEDSTESVYANSFRVLALGPDGKIYYRHNFTQGFLGVVNDPDAPAAACDFVRDGFLTGNDTIICLTNNCKRYHDSEMPWVLGITEQSGPERAQVWPVPLTDAGWLRLSSGSVLDELRWLDACGRVVRRTTTTPVNGLALQRSGLPAGAYVVQASYRGALVGVASLVID